MTSQKNYLLNRLRSPFSQAWPEWLGGILLGLLNVLFFAWAYKPFTIYSGYWTWGMQLWSKLWPNRSAPQPLYNITSVGDIGLLLGALLAATLAGEFKLRPPRSLSECFEAVTGGLLMAAGVVLSHGCNWGGFFSGITALSLHGFAMLPGLIIGGYIGSRYVNWKISREFQAFVSGEARLAASPITIPKSIGKAIKVAGLAALACLALNYLSGGPTLYLGVLLLGAIIGAVIQRARFCFATAFRDMLNPEGEARRALRLQLGIVLGLLVGVTGVAILKSKGMVDASAYVKPVSLANILGGVLFGLGMVLAGSCASGMLWRVGEGHITQLIAMITTVIAYPVLKQAVYEHAAWLVEGAKLYLPSLGWTTAMTGLYLALTAWLVSIIWLEYRLAHGVRA